jgi:hypothetical protein
MSECCDGLAQPKAESVEMPTTSALGRSEKWDHLLARIGYRRSQHRIQPGLYVLGHPGPEAPVFVTANYTLSFDALRAALSGIDGRILVLDTHGVNVWCAAAKGTFGTEELARRIEDTGLAEIVSHRRLVVPQLGAAGIAAHEVLKRTGFAVEYGPVRAHDLPEYLLQGHATDEMRLVRFNLRDRLVLVPVELVTVTLPTLLAAIAMWFLAGPIAASAVVAAALAGSALFPALLPWLPTRECTTKAAILGLAVALPFAVAAGLAYRDTPLLAAITSVAAILAMTPITAYLGLNFTGSTTFTSRTGVRREIDTYIRPMAASFAVGLVLLALAGLAMKTGLIS